MSPTRAIVRTFGLVSGLRAVEASLLSVRGADRDVKGCVGVAQGRGEDIRRPQVSARDEPTDLHLSRAVTRLSCCVYQRGDRVVSARGLAYRATGCVGGARVERPVLTGRKARVRKAQRSPGTGGPSRRTPRAPSRRRDAGSGATSTCDRSRRPKVPAVAHEPSRSCSCMWSRPNCTLVSMQVVMRVWIFSHFRARSSPSPPSGVVPRACRREGVGWSCMASSTPVRTLHQDSSRSAKASSSCPTRS